LVATVLTLASRKLIAEERQWLLVQSIGSPTVRTSTAKRPVKAPQHIIHRSHQLLDPLSSLTHHASEVCFSLTSVLCASGMKGSELFGSRMNQSWIGSRTEMIVATNTNRCLINPLTTFLFPTITYFVQPTVLPLGIAVDQLLFMGVFSTTLTQQ
jgi:hypothetical protein